MKNKRDILWRKKVLPKIIFFTLCYFLPVFAQAQIAEKPNIILLMSDDHRSDMLGYAGQKEILTPNLDELAKKGAIFTRCYSTTPICMAARATVMTGMYEHKTGANFQTGNLSSEDWNTLAYPLLLKKNGYRIAFAGKFGFKTDEKAYKEQFDKWGGFNNHGQGSYHTEKNDYLRSYAKEYPHVSRALGAFGVDFIDESAKDTKPFCLTIFFKTPHTPRNFIDEADSKLYEDVTISKPKNWGREFMQDLPVQAKISRQNVWGKEWTVTDESYQSAIKKYFRLISGMDSAIGMILDSLQKNNLDKNTIIIYTSDNGYFCGSKGLGGKVLPYEESAKLPCLIYDPRDLKAQGLVVESLVGNIDFAPTVLDFAGVNIPEKMDGRSLLPVLKDNELEIHDNLLIFNSWAWGNYDFSRSLSILAGNWKYNYWVYGDDKITPSEELFNLKKDPLELNNLVSKVDRREVLAKMRNIYDECEHKIRQKSEPQFTKIATKFSRKIKPAEKNFKKAIFKGKAKNKPIKYMKLLYEDLSN